MSKEFFRVATVAEAREGFRPERRTPVESVALADALGRIPAADVTASGPLPGFARATVDGYAVSAPDTFGASESTPAYLTVSGSVAMGEPAQGSVVPGNAIAIATGGALPPGADAVVMVEHTSEAMSGVIEVTRPAAPGDGVVRADEDVAEGAVIARAGRPLRPHDLGLLAAGGVVSLQVHRRPLVVLVSTGDEVVPPERRTLEPGQVRDATATALAALVARAGGTSDFAGIVPDDRERLRTVLEAALERADLVVVSAGSSVGLRDQTARAISSLGPPGIWCHGLALKPGKPTLLAECRGVPLVGLPGNPLSALVVFRLVGVPLVRLVGGCTAVPAPPSTTARLARDVPSATGRLDLVQVRLRDGEAEPLFGKSALLSTLGLADGFLVVPQEAGGLFAGTEVEVEVYD